MRTMIPETAKILGYLRWMDSSEKILNTIFSGSRNLLTRRIAIVE